MKKETYYLLKVQGKAKIPDYIQVRDEHFTLVGYFRPERASKTSRGKENPKQQIFSKIEAIAEDVPFGKITKVEV